MDYTYDELSDYIELLCNRLNIPKIPLVMDPSMPTNYTMPTIGRAGFINVNPFCRYVNALPLELTLAHEVRHAWQYHTGLLRPNLFFGGVFWKGELKPYVWHSAPWEIDAVNYENEVAIGLGYPVSRFVHNGIIFELDKPTGLNTEQKEYALKAKEAA